MTNPQPGIFALGTRYHHHLEFDVSPTTSADAIADALRDICQPHGAGGATNLVIGFGPDLWARLAPNDGYPDDLGPFTRVEGRDGHIAPATQHDVWVWIHGRDVDDVIDAAGFIELNLAGVATLVDETPCFVYHDSRDLTGFVDGTANPTPNEAPRVACIPTGRAGAGGSHVLAQRWVHDLVAFNAQPVDEQERVFGRTKLDSVELPDDTRPSDAHIALVEIHDAEGNERPIYRRSTPYGSLRERGLYFLAFSAERNRYDEMLKQMYGSEGGTIRDRLLGYTTAVSGSYYFAPSAETLSTLTDGVTT